MIRVSGDGAGSAFEIVVETDPCRQAGADLSKPANVG
jgi:hypothetical protein